MLWSLRNGEIKVNCRFNKIPLVPCPITKLTEGSGMSDIEITDPNLLTNQEKDR
jgi:hypothetical protein